MKASQVYGQFLSGDDVKPGQDLTLTISDVALDTLKREGEDGKRRLILSFKEINQRLALNSENAQSIIDAIGDETDDWTGHTIVLWNDPSVQFRGRKVGGVRIRSIS